MSKEIFNSTPTRVDQRHVFFGMILLPSPLASVEQFIHLYSSDGRNNSIATTSVINP
jgi:hypothetical protein